MTYIFLVKKVQMLPLQIFSRNQDAAGSRVSSLVQWLNWTEVPFNLEALGLREGWPLSSTPPLAPGGSGISHRLVPLVIQDNQTLSTLMECRWAYQDHVFSNSFKRMLYFIKEITFFKKAMYQQLLAENAVSNGCHGCCWKKPAFGLCLKWNL